MINDYTIIQYNLDFAFKPKLMTSLMHVVVKQQQRVYLFIYRALGNFILAQSM